MLVSSESNHAEINNADTQTLTSTDDNVHKRTKTNYIKEGKTNRDTKGGGHIKRRKKKQGEIQKERKHSTVRGAEEAYIRPKNEIKTKTKSSLKRPEDTSH